MKKQLLMWTLGTVALIATSLPAVATDDKTYAGAMCQPINQNLSYVSLSNGTVFNTSTTSNLLLSCPIVRDTMAGNSKGITSAFVKVIDAHPQQDVSCTLSSFYNNGQEVVSVARKTSGSSTGVQTLSFPSLKSVTDGFYHLSCAMPILTDNRYSGIVMYGIDEAN